MITPNGINKVWRSKLRNNVQTQVRFVGLSNETPWGLQRCLQLAEAGQGTLPRIVSLQNAYSLLCRTFDMALAECCHIEGVSFLAYSPLAMGLLTGAYCMRLLYKCLAEKYLTSFVNLIVQVIP